MLFFATGGIQPNDLARVTHDCGATPADPKYGTKVKLKAGSHVLVDNIDRAPKVPLVFGLFETSTGSIFASVSIDHLAPA
jgi:hypothetical protein